MRYLWIQNRSARSKAKGREPKKDLIVKMKIRSQFTTSLKKKTSGWTMTQGAGQIRPWSRKGLKNRFPNYAGHFPFDTYYFRTLLSPKIFSKREQYISNSCEPFEGSRSLWSSPWAKSRKQISGYLQGEGRKDTHWLFIPHATKGSLSCPDDVRVCWYCI